MTVGSENLMTLDNHFVQEGLAYRITPYNTRTGEVSNFDTEKTYDNVMKRFKFGGVKTKGIYLDETVMRMCLTHKMLMVDLAEHLADEEQPEKALEVLAKMDTELPPTNVPHDLDCRKIEGRYLGYQDGKQAFYVTGSSFREAVLYTDLGHTEKALPILDYLWKRANDYLNYYMSFSGNSFLQEQESCLMQLAQMNRLIQAYYGIDQKKAEELFRKLDQRCQQLQQKGCNLEAVHWQ
jgi:tetratricopeptide (TPR) repeat protein